MVLDRKEKEIFNLNKKCKYYGEVLDSDILSLELNKKRLIALRKYQNKLITKVENTQDKNLKRYLFDLLNLLEIVDCDFLEYNKKIKDNTLN